MSRRFFSVLAVPFGAAVAAAAAGSQLLCEGRQTPEEEKDSRIKAEKTNSKENVKKCNLTGQWENDLGSKMTVFKVDDDGNFSGEYLTAVSSTTKAIQVSPLVGTQHLDKDENCTFGFTVNWKKFSDSTAVFVGQCFTEGGGDEVLHTSWLLREKVDSEHSDWKATRVGRNTFHRVG